MKSYSLSTFSLTVPFIILESYAVGGPLYNFYFTVSYANYVSLDSNQCKTYHGYFAYVLEWHLECIAKNRYQNGSLERMIWCHILHRVFLSYFLLTIALCQIVYAIYEAIVFEAKATFRLYFFFCINATRALFFFFFFFFSVVIHVEIAYKIQVTFLDSFFFKQWLKCQ